MGARSQAWVRTGAALAAVGAALALSVPAQAATREPLALAFASSQAWAEAPASAPVARRNPSTPATGEGAAGFESAAYEPQISSAHYGQDQIESVRATLEGLDHGPEMAQLSVWIATPAEIAEICGAAVIACYQPEVMRMVVSGVEGPVDGVSRRFAIAHEYGHHIANTQRGEILPAIEGGTIRWATYERVCQLTRSDRLFPGNQGAHYWQDPEEAFAESYAHLSDPGARVSWQYTPLLRPTTASLAKLQVDLSHPWTGPVSSAFSGSIGTPAPATRRAARGPDGTAIGGGEPLGVAPGSFSRNVATPLDGRVSVTVQAPPGADLAVALRDPSSGRVLARASTGEGGSATLAYSNCGHDSLRLEVRSLQGPGSFAFTGTIVKP